jgi:hypothetical protein
MKIFKNPTFGHFARIEDSKSADYLRPPTIYDNQINAYKEWQHFNVFDKKTNLFLLLNFAIIGNPYDLKHGIVARIAVVKSPENKIFCAVEPESIDSLKISYLNPGVKFKGVSTIFKEKTYEVRVNMDIIPLVADLHFQISSQPLTSHTKPFGSGFLGWTVFPRMIVDGCVAIEGKEYHITNSYGYHDHDWGRYYWGEDIGWEWGIFAEDNKYGYTLLFDRRTDRIKGNIFEEILMVYRGKTLIASFSEKNLQVKFMGNFQGKKITIPGLMRLIHQESSSYVPEKVIMTGIISKREKITIYFKPEIVIQIIVPNHSGYGQSQLNQMLGNIEIRNSINEVEISNNNIRGYMELVGPIS